MAPPGSASASVAVAGLAFLILAHVGRDLTASIPLRARRPRRRRSPTTGWDNDVLTVWLAFASPVELVFVLGKEGVMDSMQFIYWLLEMLSNWFSSQGLPS